MLILAHFALSDVHGTVKSCLEMFHLLAKQQSGLMSSVGLGPVILRSSLSICMGAYRLPANELSIPLGLGSFIQDSTYDNGWGEISHKP